MQKKFSTHIFKPTTDLVILFLEDYLEILLALIFKSGQEIELSSQNTLSFSGSLRNESWNFLQKAKTWQNKLNRTFLTTSTHQCNLYLWVLHSIGNWFTSVLNWEPLNCLKLVDSWKVGLYKSPKVTHAMTLVAKLPWESGS